MVFLKGKFHSDAVRGAAAPERPGDVTCRGPGPPLLAVRRGPAQERPGNRETPGNIGRLWAGRVRVAPVVRPAAVSRRASQPPVARTGERARRRENPRVGCEAPYFRSGDRFQPFWAFHAWGKSGPDREKRQCGRLRAFDSGAMAGFGLEMGLPPFGRPPGPRRTPGTGGVHWQWVGRTVQVGQRLGTVETWSGDERIAVHPLARRAGRRFILPASPASGKACPWGWPAPPGGGGGAGPRR